MGRLVAQTYTLNANSPLFHSTDKQFGSFTDGAWNNSPTWFSPDFSQSIGHVVSNIFRKMKNPPAEWYLKRCLTTEALTLLNFGPSDNVNSAMLNTFAESGLQFESGLMGNIVMPHSKKEAAITRLCASGLHGWRSP